jgi:transposase
MIGLGKWVDIVAAHRRGVSIRQIARETGVSRNAVRRALRSDGAPAYKRQRRPSILDPYKEYLDKRLEEYPTLTAKKLFREIGEQGYSGSLTTVREYTRPLRKKRKGVAIRFETPPGRQAQCDFTELGYHEIAGVRMKLYIFLMVLGYSRMTYAHVTLDMGQTTFLACHEQAFAYFGGVTEEILYDNPKTIVTKREGGQVIFNAALLDFAGLYGYTPKVHRPYRPQTKGKVERTCGYLKSDFLEGETFIDLDDMQKRLIIWLDGVANIRIHETTQKRPIDLLTQEKLLPSRLAKPGIKREILSFRKDLPQTKTPSFRIGQAQCVEPRPLEVYEEVVCR